MTPPTEHDISSLDPPALETWQAAEQSDTKAWSEFFDASIFGEEQVRETLLESGYPPERLHFVRARSRRRCPRARRTGSRCCGSTPTGTSRPATSSSTSTRGWPAAAC